MGDQQPAKQRADHLRDAEGDHVQRVGSRQRLEPDDGRDDGPADRLVDAAGRRVDGHQPVEHPDVVNAGPGLGGDRRGGRPQHQCGAECHLAPVVGIGNRSAVEPGEHQRHQCEGTEQPDVQARSGQRVDLEADRDQGQLPAHRRECIADPQPPEGGAFAQGSQVGKDSGHGPSLATGGTPKWSLS